MSLARLRDAPDFPLSAKKGGRILAHHRLYTRAVCSALYDGGVRSVDRWIGRLVQALKRAGLYERTLLVVTSDHGEQLGETPDPGGGRARDGRFYDAHGYTMYEEMLRVPLIVKLPGRRHAGRRIAAVSRAIDVMPTILDVLGLSSNSATMQGSSLRPLWEGGGGTSRLAFSEALAGEGESKSLRSDRYKYILSFDPGQVAERGRAFVSSEPAATELYDLQGDPGERHSLLTAATTKTTRLAERLDAELRQVAGERRGKAGRTRLSPDTLERIKALGYVQ